MVAVEVEATEASHPLLPRPFLPPRQISDGDGDDDDDDGDDRGVAASGGEGERIFF